MALTQLIDHARPRDGVFTRFDAHRLGVWDPELRRLRRAGVVQEVHPKVFMFSAVPVTARSHIRAAVAAGGGLAVAGYSSAALLLGLDDTPMGRPEIVTTARVAPDLRGVRVHRTRSLDPCDLTEVDGVVTTNGPRTVIDLSTRQSRNDTIDLADRAIGARAAKRAGLHARATVLRNGRRGVGNVVDVTEPGADGTFWSALERSFGESLSRTDLPRPLFNAPLRHRGRLFVVDGLWPDADLVVELNSVRFHSRRSDHLRDKERANVMALLRLRLLVFGWRDVTEGFDTVAAQIRDALAGGARARPVP